MLDRDRDANVAPPTAMARYLIDGTNVMGSRPDGWWRDRPAARRRLVAEVAAWARRAGVEVTVVFDGRGHDLGEHAGVAALWATRAGRDAADDDIARLAKEDSDAASLTVVTSDAALARRAREAGAGVEGAGGFRARLQPSSRS